MLLRYAARKVGKNVKRGGKIGSLSSTRRRELRVSPGKLFANNQLGRSAEKIAKNGGAKKMKDEIKGF